MPAVDKIQKLESGVILYLDANDDIIRTSKDTCRITTINDTGFTIYEDGRPIVSITASLVTRLEYFPNAEAPAALSPQALALELAENFFRG